MQAAYGHDHRDREGDDNTYSRPSYAPSHELQLDLSAHHVGQVVQSCLAQPDGVLDQKRPKPGCLLHDLVAPEPSVLISQFGSSDRGSDFPRPRSSKKSSARPVKTALLGQRFACFHCAAPPLRFSRSEGLRAEGPPRPGPARARSEHIEVYKQCRRLLSVGGREGPGQQINGDYELLEAAAMAAECASLGIIKICRAQDLTADPAGCA